MCAILQNFVQNKTHIVQNAILESHLIGICIPPQSMTYQTTTCFFVFVLYFMIILWCSMWGSGLVNFMVTGYNTVVVLNVALLIHLGKHYWPLYFILLLLWIDFYKCNILYCFKWSLSNIFYTFFYCKAFNNVKILEKRKKKNGFPKWKVVLNVNLARETTIKLCNNALFDILHMFFTFILLFDYREV